MNPSVPTFCLDTLFEQQAARTPGAVALVDGNGAMTFAELGAASDCLAAALRPSGIRDGAFVGVHMERSRHYVASVLGVLKAGGAVMPLPLSYPTDRLRTILQSAALDAVIDDHGTPFDPPLHDRTLHVSEAIAASVTNPIAPSSDPERPAFVLCSSGSTGKPKMIVRSHRSFSHRLQWTWSTHPYAAGEVCCQKAHMTTTHAIYELFEPLLRGTPVHIFSDQQARALESFWETIRRQGISRLLIVPSVLQASLDMPSFAPPDIKVLVLMGEYVHPRLAARTVAAFPEAAGIYSIYGSTEASSTLVCDLREGVRRGGELPLGKPISADVHAYVLGDDPEPVAAGSTGMLHIAGPALFTSYFRDPALTDAAIRIRGGERLYSTNDRVRLMTDGALQYLGRTDHTVKVRGFRVDLQEVEWAIAAHPGVGQCAVIAMHSGDGSAALTAFVSPATVQPADVYHVLRERLPDYMLPSRVIGLDTLPLTSSGKIDRRKLAEHSGSTPVKPSSGRPRSAIEQRLAAVWGDALGHDAFDVDSNFFEVGGTSLKTFSVIVQLREAFGLARHQLPDNAVYRFSTIKALAACIDGVRGGSAPIATADDSVLVTLRRGRDAEAPPLFVISSAGGTLGAYEKVSRALKTTREVIGVRDPYLWGERDPTLGFQSWIALYLDAIRERQPKGPYHLMAYSSAGAFGYEIARRLREDGENVGLLALIDPLATDRASKWRFGYWALEARFMRRELARIVLLWGRLRRIVPRGLRKNGSASANDFAFTQAQFGALETEAKTSWRHILQLSALLELNTGLPFALMPAELDALAPERYLDALLVRVRSVATGVDTETLERLVVQYALQVHSQHRYRLQRYDSTLVLFDPDGPHHGLLASQFRPYVDRLIVHRLTPAPPAGRVRELAEYFAQPLRAHYLSMRDDTYVQALAMELDKLLQHPEAGFRKTCPDDRGETTGPVQARETIE